MGVDSKKPPPLPAPTEESESTITKQSDLAPSDLDKPTDEKSSYSLPEDGTPVTIKTRGHMSNKSQTSLLIEYFEGGKVVTSPGSSGNPNGDRKPSVRVRLTPSKNRKNDHIQITETKSSSGRKASLTRRQDRASLTPTQVRSEDALSVMSGDAEDAKSMTSYQSATEESNVSRNPIEVEIDRSGRHRRRRPASPLIPAADSKASYQPGNMSDISAIPTDSFLDGSGPSSRYDEKRSKSPSRAREVIGSAAAGLAAAAVADKMRSKSRSELTDKERVVMSKSRDRDRSERRQKSKHRKSSGSSDHHSESGKSSRKRSSKTNEESVVSGADSSVVSSAITGSHRSGDASSMRSGTSRYSINNPKLLETVEDAIRRLILPELVAIKREQSKREARRSSVSSETTMSKDGTSSERRHSGYSTKSRETLGRRVVSRDRETGRHELLESPAPSVDQDSVDESLHEIERISYSGNGDNKLKAAAAGTTAGVLAAAAMHEGSAREQRRRRRAEARSRQPDRHTEEDDDDPAPPMPLMSEISQSEITRTSILSAETERPHSATDELTPIQRVPKGTPSLESTSTTRTNSPAPTKNSSILQSSLGLQHANLSHGDLRTLPQRRTGGLEEEYEREYGRRAPIREQDFDDEDEYDDSAYSNYYTTQEVPPPLKYVPYQPERRGLSPIPSVSGYTEGGSEVHQRESRVSQRTSDSYSSPTKSFHRGGDSPSLLSQGSFGDDRSLESSRAGYRNTTYTDDSELARIRSGQGVRAVGANPDFVSSPGGVESHVASLVEGSMLTDSVLTGESGHSGPYRGNRASAEAAAMLGGAPRLNEVASSREQTPEPPRVVEEDTVSEMSEDPESHQSQQYEEYDLDQYGRKIPRSKYRQSPTTEAAITGAAVGAAAAALRAAAKGKGKQEYEEEWAGEGIQRNKSFKDRTREGHLPANTPTHSVDRLVEQYEKPKVGHSGLPDVNDPMPEIGFYGHDDDELTNPSRMSDRMSATQEAKLGQWQEDEPTTPTQESIHARHGLTMEEAAGAAAVATAAAMAHSHSRQSSEDVDAEWYRTSEDRKRDTIVTNPYEGTSPLANAPGLDIELPSGAPRFDPHAYDQYDSRSPFGPKIDEGYISQGPNRTPDIKATGPDYNSPPPPLPNIANPFLNRQEPEYMSGMDQGMGSPMYEAATGTGIERIESKDIIALMQHLMVRDAQRSARDTEILHTLVQTASEMRNSFDDIKKMVAETEDVVITEVKDNTEKTVQKHIGGPRPFPGSGARSFQTGSQGGTDHEKKTRNLWRRAIKGLSAKGTNDLTRIEDMLMQLLGEVDVLKAQTAQGGSGASLDNIQSAVQYEQDRGYEPEGHAGTSTASYASQSGHLSIPRNPSAKSAYERKVSGSGQRISTVPEGDEEDNYNDSNIVVHNRSDTDMMSPVQEITRGTSVPLGTPPQLPAGAQAPLSNDNTPRDSKGKKHKSSGSSSWFPKISRWSETTASSLGKPFRKSNVTDANSFRGPSRSGSDLGNYEEHPEADPYSGDQLHTGFSSTHLHPQAQRQDPDQIETGSTDMAFTMAGISRTPVPAAEQDDEQDSEDELELPQNSPFLEQHYGTPEDPKYKAHRNSLNLQHPQPRQGQTEHFQTLETSAQEFSPMSPASADWAGSVNSLTRFTAGANNGHQPRFSNGINAASQGQYTWEGSSSPHPVASASGGPPRPAKEPLERGTQSPVQRGVTPTRSRISNLAYKPAGSPKPENRILSNVIGPPARRPSGPRAMGTRSPAPEGEEQRRKRYTFGAKGSSEHESDTF
ncbi:unnamed protein product [Discula destructiva]